jgi:CspA family cold shock protein
MEGFKTLKQGSRVNFEVQDGPKGLLAQNIQSVEPTQTNAGASMATSSNSESFAGSAGSGSATAG